MHSIVVSYDDGALVAYSCAPGVTIDKIIADAKRSAPNGVKSFEITFKVDLDG